MIERLGLSEIFLDTGVVIGALFPGTPDAQACSIFCEHLVAAGSRVYISQVMRLDLARVLRRLATKPDKLPIALRDAYAPNRWGENPLIRQRWLRHGVREFQQFLNQFTAVAEVPITLGIWRESIDVMASEGLDSSDALHLATARVIGIADFATTDRDVRSIASPRVHVIRDPV